MSEPSDLRTILIVDDDESVRRALVRSFARPDHQILSAGSAEEALELLGARDVDLVITDLVLPGMDGLDLVGRLRDSHPDIQVIIVTAYGSPESTRAAGALGVACYLDKPFDLSELKSRARALLEARERPEASRREGGRRVGRGALRFVGVATGKTVSMIAGTSRRALRLLWPRNLVVGAGAAAGAAARAWDGILRVFVSAPKNGVNGQ